MPYAISNFEEITNGEYYYIDKTKYIENLERTKFPVFLRPRRFGKSLFTEMLRWYYDIKAKDKFEKIFGNTYIGKNPSGKQNSFFFLSLDFSGMSDLAEQSTSYIKQCFDNKVIERLTNFLYDYQDILKLEDDFIRNFKLEYKNGSSTGLNALINLVHRNDGKLYITIDEYDSLTNALAAFYKNTDSKDNEYLKILQKGGFFRSFFEILKDNTKSGIEQIYITGILPITLCDMNSGFNIASWISLEENFSTMLGITEQEFINLLDQIYSDYSISLPKDEVAEKVKTTYNGYRFTENGESVYNPMMTCYYLNSIIKYNLFPNYLLDNNLRTDYGQIDLLFGNNISHRDKTLISLADKKQIEIDGPLNISFDMRDYKDGKYIVEGLYYFGIITHSEEPGIMQIPNLVTYSMAISYFENINNVTPNSLDLTAIVGDYKRRGNFNSLIQNFFELIIQKFPGDFFADVNESFYRGLLYHILDLSFTRNLYEVYPEFTLPNGQVDIYLHTYQNARVPLVINDLIEVKRVAKSASDAAFKNKFEEGVKQMKKYKTKEFKHFRGIVVCFRGNKDFLVEQIGKVKSEK